MVLTKNIILKGFRQFGIKAGDKYIVHISMKSLGWVEGGAETVIEAMIESVSPGGTVFIPTMTFGKPFNPKRTPPETGKIPDVFWRRPDAVRSLSPSHSIAGIGPDAEHILEDHEKTIPNGPDSPLGKLADENGSIMLVGVTHKSNTAIHICTYLAELPYLDVWREIEVFDDDGNVEIVKVLNPGCSGGFDNLEPFIMEKNAQQIKKIGNATVRYMKASDIIEIGVEALKDNPALLLCERPDCLWCANARKILGGK